MSPVGMSCLKIVDGLTSLSPYWNDGFPKSGCTNALQLKWVIEIHGAIPNISIQVRPTSFLDWIPAQPPTQVWIVGTKLHQV